MSNKKKIFIVEDNDLNLKLFRDLLENNNYDVTYTQEGREAFDMVLKNMPDLILMDIQLHGISGFDIIEQIKGDDRIKNIPIAAVTAFAMKDDKDKIMASGCDIYISKPIAIKSFLETIHGLLNKN